MARIRHEEGFTLSGKAGNAVYCVRRGTPYVRSWVRPNNPDSEAQRKSRGKFADAVAAWRSLSPRDKEGYRERARWMARTGYNLFVSEFLGTEPKGTSSGGEETVCEALREVVLAVMEARELRIHAKVRAKVAKCADAAVLKRWAARAAVAASAEAALAES